MVILYLQEQRWSGHRYIENATIDDLYIIETRISIWWNIDVRKFFNNFSTLFFFFAFSILPMTKEYTVFLLVTLLYYGILPTYPANKMWGGGAPYLPPKLKYFHNFNFFRQLP